jgi:oligoendopeptidase F
LVAQARRYRRREANLDENNILVEVVERLIAAAKGAEPLRRYHRLRRESSPERYHCSSYSRSGARLAARRRAAGTGRRVVAIFRRPSDRGARVRRALIDVYENEGKRSGAFGGRYGVHPTCSSTTPTPQRRLLAHEMGHTMHTELSHPTSLRHLELQHLRRRGASMTNESLDLLLRERTAAGVASRCPAAIDDIAASFYRQAMFADFELEAHRCVERGEPVTAEALQQLYLASLHAIFESTLDDTECDRNTWARIPHFYGSPYYVYQYATSKAVASLLHRRMTDGPPEARAATVERYLELLRAGGNDHPIAQLRRADVDVETAEPVAALVATMASLVERLEVEVKGLAARG